MSIPPLSQLKEEFMGTTLIDAYEGLVRVINDRDGYKSTKVHNSRIKSWKNTLRIVIASSGYKLGTYNRARALGYDPDGLYEHLICISGHGPNDIGFYMV